MVRRAGFALLTCGLAVAAPLPVAAQVLLPETGLNVDFGGGVRMRPSHLGSTVYVGDFVPLLNGQWGKDLHFSIDDGIQYTMWRHGRFKFGPDIEYRLAYNDHLAPRTLRTSGALEAGVFAKVDLTYAELETRVRKATSGYGGYSGDITLDTLIPIEKKWSVGLEARFGWADRRFSYDRFGLRALPGEPVVNTTYGDYYSAGAQAALFYQVRPRTQMFMTTSIDQILRPSRAVSNARTRTAYTLMLGATRRFTW